MKARITEEMQELLAKPESARGLMNYIIKTPKDVKFDTAKVKIDKETVIQVSSSSTVAYVNKT